jgi:alkanesulfonate monooxygenase SsuD/methylene tetrahydromethanopterin reductase-like flavin-dependent oxidoreductase (luciferase family)
MTIEAFTADYVEKLDGAFWQIRDFKLSPEPMQKPHPPIYTAAATTPESAKFAGTIGHGLVQPGYLGIPFELVRDLTSIYRNHLPGAQSSDVILGIHLHVARDREEGVENGALALSSQADVFLRSSQSRPTLSGVKEAYATKSASRAAFEKLSTPQKARCAVAKEGPNIMAVWGTPSDCVEKIKFYAAALGPEQLMLNIASGSLPQQQVLASMRLFAREVMPALRSL